MTNYLTSDLTSNLTGVGERFVLNFLWWLDSTKLPSLVVLGTSCNVILQSHRAANGFSISVTLPGNQAPGRLSTGDQVPGGVTEMKKQN